MIFDYRMHSELGELNRKFIFRKKCIWSYFLRVPDATRENVIEKVTGEGAISYRTINNAGPRARICKRLRSPGIDSEKSIPLAYVARRAGTTNTVFIPAHQAGNRFRGSLKGLQIRALSYRTGHTTSQSAHYQVLRSLTAQYWTRFIFSNIFWCSPNILVDSESHILYCI
jgi:hypothetical protein